MRTEREVILQGEGGKIEVLRYRVAQKWKAYVQAVGLVWIWWERGEKGDREGAFILEDVSRPPYYGCVQLCEE